MSVVPSAYLPFALDAETARARLRREIGRSWFAPNGFADEAKLGAIMNGAYVPFWSFSGSVTGSYGLLGLGGSSEAFADELVPGWKGATADLTWNVAWPLKSLRPYDRNAEGAYDVLQPSVTLPEARQRMIDLIESRIVKRVNKGRTKNRVWRGDFDFDWRALDAKLILLPLWTAEYTWRGKTYKTIIDGIDGSVRMHGPISWPKLAGALASLAAAGYAAWRYFGG